MLDQRPAQGSMPVETRDVQARLAVFLQIPKRRQYDSSRGLVTSRR